MKRLACTLLLVTLGFALPLRAQPNPFPANTPRGSLDRFLEAAREGDFVGAASFLELTEPNRARGPELARRLKAVVDRHVWFELSAISDRLEGDASDGLPPLEDEIGRIPPSRQGQPLRLRRVGDGEQARWLFTAQTVSLIDDWYRRLPNRWVLDHFPPLLLRPGPLDLLWWQWLALPLLALAAFALAHLLGRLSIAVMRRLAARTKSAWDDILLERLFGPFRLAWALGVFFLTVPLLDLYAPAEQAIHKTLRVVAFALLFWALMRLVSTTGEFVASTAWAQSRPASRSLIRLGTRVATVGVLIIAGVAIVSALGYPVASLLAGLGIGGLAVALGAQKTLENVFGAFSLGVDQPFREGDFVRIEDFVGTVEAIGLRSTRIRTLDRTLISVPNGKLADARLESFTARDRIRLACTIGLVYGTTASQMRAVLAGLEGVLRAHPKIWPDAVVVRFKEFACSSLDIEVMAWFQTPDWSEFQLIRQDVLLQYMEVVERSGTRFALPTQRVHLVNDGATP